MASFQVPCPSCEANVPIKSRALIGKKADCPKCKYRFKVPDPDMLGDAVEPSETEAVATPKAKSKSSPKLAIGVGLGVLAVGVLGIGGYMMLGGSDTPTPKPPIVQRSVVPQAAQDGGDAAAVPPDDLGTGVIKDNGQFGVPGTVIAKGPVNNAPEIPQAVAKGKLKDATNMLPNGSAAVLRVNFERINSTPIYSSFFDRQTLDFFKTSMFFDATDISNVYLALVDADRDPFVLIRTKAPVPVRTMLEKMDIEKGPLSPIKERGYSRIKSNAFLTAISRLLSSESLLGETGIPITEEDRKRWAEKPMAMTIYDSQTIIIGEMKILERYLVDLDKDGSPTYLSELTPNVPIVAPTAPTDPGSAGGNIPRPQSAGASISGPGGPGNTGPPVGQDSGGSSGGGPGSPGAPPPATAKAPLKLYTSIPTYRTVKPELKRMLNRLEADELNPPGLLYADVLDQRVVDRDFRSVYAAIGGLIGDVFNKTKILGIGINSFQKDKFTGVVAFDFVSAEDAKETANTQLASLFNLLKAPVGFLLGTQIVVKNNAGGQNGPSAGGSPGGSPGSFGSQGSSGGGSAAAAGPVDDDGKGGPPSFGPQGPTTGPLGAGAGDANASHVDIGVSDTLASVDIEILWKPESYTKLIAPAVVNLTSQMKGRMAVLSGSTTTYNLSSAYGRMVENTKNFPRGTLQRDTRSDRYGLQYPPDQRVSFLVELLPYLNKGGIRQEIQDKKFPWYAKENEKAAGTWIPEFLVSYYPQSAWRANHSLAPGRSLGATNYVGVSGVGLDSARYDAKNPEQVKKMGMTGYGWGSRPADVTDGLSNTIYLLQVPPSHTRPWIAGGGATVQGLDETSNPMDDFAHTLPDKKRGTYALMADGSTRFLPAGIDPAIFRALATRAGGEKLDDLDKVAPIVAPPKGVDGGELRGSGAIAKDPSTKTAPAPDAKADEAIKAELDLMQGKWKATKIYSGKLRQDAPAQVVAVMQVQVVGSRIIILVQGKEVSVDEIKIESLTAPKKMIFTAIRTLDPEGKVGEKTYIAYELTKDKLIICEGEDKSTEFPKAVVKPEAGSTGSYVELERVVE